MQKGKFLRAEFMAQIVTFLVSMSSKAPLKKGRRQHGYSGLRQSSHAAPSEILVVDGAAGGVGRGATPADAQILHLAKRECAFRSARRVHGEEVRAFHVVQIEGRPGIGRRVRNLHMARLKIAHVAKEEA